MSKVTLLDVAEAAGVSIGTASRAVNRMPKVSDVARQRVEEAVRQLGYRQNPRKQRTVAILIPTLEVTRLEDYFCLMFNAFRNEIHARGYRAVTVSREDYPLLNTWPAAGAVSFDYIEEISRQFPRNSNIPLVCCNDRPNHLENVYCIRSNSRKVLREAVDHLVGLGHIRIGCSYFQEARPLTSIPSYSNLVREAMAAHGLESSCICRPYSTDLPHHEALGMLLREKVTALIAVNHSMRTDRFLKISGLRIPEDISLVAGDTLSATHMTPRHTVIAIRYAEMARRAIDMLETVWNGGKILRDVELDSELIVRESTGPAPATPRRG